MHKPLSFFIYSCIASFPLTVNAIPAPAQTPTSEDTNFIEQSKFTPFTGKIIKNKVRMRLSPSLDSPVLRELNKDDLLVVVSEDEDFYAVQAPHDIKAYVYRTFVLDNVVEGNHVNIRLEPDLEAPVIVQLNSGDQVDGVISPINSKWLEIATPKTTRFYVAKDFIEKIGDPSLIATITKKRDSVNRLLESTYQISEIELEKPYQQIQMDGIFNNLNQIISDKNNLNDQIDKARTMLTAIQDKYLQKKIAFLEEKPQQVYITKFQNENNDHVAEVNTIMPPREKNLVTAKMSAWIPHEESIYQTWVSHNESQSIDEFYLNQKQQAITLAGLVESYDRSVKNKPGDYLLVNPSTHLPIDPF